MVQNIPGIEVSIPRSKPRTPHPRSNALPKKERGKAKAATHQNREPKLIATLKKSKSPPPDISWVDERDLRPNDAIARTRAQQTTRPGRGSARRRGRGGRVAASGQRHHLRTHQSSLAVRFPHGVDLVPGHPVHPVPGVDGCGKRNFVLVLGVLLIGRRRERGTGR